MKKIITVILLLSVLSPLFSQENNAAGEEPPKIELKGSGIYQYFEYQGETLTMGRFSEIIRSYEPSAAEYKKSNAYMGWAIGLGSAGGILLVWSTLGHGLANTGNEDATLFDWPLFGVSIGCIGGAVVLGILQGKSLKQAIAVFNSRETDYINSEL